MTKNKASTQDCIKGWKKFYVHGPVHRESLSIIVQQGTTIQGVTGGTDQTSGECLLGQTIPI